MPTKQLTHFMHPTHKLNQLTANTSYLCDGCNIPGVGSRFSCTHCNFNLHNYCAECPTRLTSPTNHVHPMSLVVHKAEPNQPKPCQICHNSIEGLAYECKDCNFWIHSLCASQNSGWRGQSRDVPRGSGSEGVGKTIGLGLLTNSLYDVMKSAFQSSSE